MTQLPGLLLILGATGQVGSELMSAAKAFDRAAVGLSHQELDICDIGAVTAAIERHRPTLVVNAAGYTAVDRAESEPDAAFAANRDGPAGISAACVRAGVAVIHISTDYVFDGDKRTPYREDDPVNPLSVYGASKAAGEDAVRARLDRHVILRTSWVFSAHRQNFVKTMLRLAPEREELRIVADQTGCPTAARDIAAAILQIAGQLSRSDETRWGTYHYCGTPPVNWYGFAEAILAAAGDRLRGRLRVVPVTTAEYPLSARRPANSVLDCSRVAAAFGVAQPSWSASMVATLDRLFTNEALEGGP